MMVFGNWAQRAGLVTRWAWVLLGFTLVRPIQAQPVDAKADALHRSIDWKTGPCKGDLAGVATIEVPAGYKFVQTKDTGKFLELTQNLPNPNVAGVLLPADERWFVVFEKNTEGYIKDDEKDKLDAGELLKAIQEGANTDNQERRKRGYPEITITGWEKEPFFDNDTKTLSWAYRYNAPGEVGVNYQTRLLGRRGFMGVQMLTSPQELAGVLPEFKKVLSTFSFNAGEKYSEWREGDKVAAIGLGALIAGGIAAKTGLLAKLGKGLIYIIVAIGAGIVALFRKIGSLFGGGKQASAE
jgi:uncharacterized membrane-anchored protein